MAAGYIWSNSTTFTADSAVETLVPIPCPHRGEIRGFNLVQTTGDLEGVDAKLVTSNQDTAPNIDLPVEAFLLDTMTIANAATVVSANNLDIAFINRDGTPTSPQRFLYLRITPDGTGTKSFVFTLTIDATKAK